MLPDSFCGMGFPVSFLIGGERIEGMPEGTSLKVIEEKPGHEIYEGVISKYGIKLTFHLVEYPKYDTKEWTLWIENVSECITPVIEELYAADLVLSGKDAKVLYSNGDTCDFTLYQEFTADLAESRHFEYRPVGGRGADCALPYFRVLNAGSGHNIAIGWPGQWEVSFDNTEKGTRFRAKQQYTHFVLKPGEKVRTPRILIMDFSGGVTEATNKWRHFMVDHVIPRPNGELIHPITFACDHEGGVENELETEESQLKMLEDLKKNNALPDALWLDAGWYSCPDDNWRITGHWAADDKRFPNGLKPLGDWCRENGLDFLLWFEPERVSLKYCSDGIPDEWILKLKDTSVIDDIRMVGTSRRLMDEMGLLDMGNKDCCDWLIDTIDRVIKEYGITIYRQDMNFPPLNWWLQNDEEERKGIHENLHIQGLLRYWDTLLERNPGLWINSVASGGKRCDIETISRSVSLHQSDFGHGNHPIHQVINEFSHKWLVYSGSFIKSDDDVNGDYTVEGRKLEIPEDRKVIDIFMLHNDLLPSMCMYSARSQLRYREENPKENDRGISGFKSFLPLWKKTLPYMYNGDYFLLSPSDRTNTCYFAQQFHDTESDSGFFQVIRNTKCPEETYKVYLRGIKPDKTYVISKDGEKTEVVGRALIDRGYDVKIPKRSGGIWFYR